MIHSSFYFLYVCYIFIFLHNSIRVGFIILKKIHVPFEKEEKDSFHALKLYFFIIIMVLLVLYPKIFLFLFPENSGDDAVSVVMFVMVVDFRQNVQTHAKGNLINWPYFKFLNTHTQTRLTLGCKKERGFLEEKEICRSFKC